MKKYKKLQATLSALAHPNIGIESINQIKFLVDMGARSQFDSSNIKTSRLNKYGTYERLKEKGMFTEVKTQRKYSLAINQLSDKGRQVYNAIIGRKSAKVTSKALQAALDMGINRLEPCILLAKLGDLPNYRLSDVDSKDTRRELFIRRAGLTNEYKRTRLLDNNGKTYLKSLYRTTTKGMTLLENLTRLVD